ncbi:helix-turn-helix transcriptional regulator [Blastococcus deserti]|uniref:Helix-turn-helix transcriptional regulator n=1 Tax=Blastococcus deserti TaxID=2259033 RepID=A0ABW4XC76_9ACTN
MNRTDRLYALVEELRAVAPRPRSSRWLAAHFEVSVRTVERDLSALQQAGVPIFATPGRGGGYALDAGMTLPPLNFTAAEALAVALALERAGRIPFGGAARSAMQKLVGAMSGPEAAAARGHADRVRLMSAPGDAPERLPASLEQAVLAGELVELTYTDGGGRTSTRVVEPVGIVGNDRAWYLVGWCRLRDAPRSFRADRITQVRPTGRRAPARPFDVVAAGLPSSVRPIGLAGRDS